MQLHTTLMHQCEWPNKQRFQKKVKILDNIYIFSSIVMAKRVQGHDLGRTRDQICESGLLTVGRFSSKSILLWLQGQVGNNLCEQQLLTDFCNPRMKPPGGGAFI